jgi:hypothetical protein
MNPELQARNKICTTSDPGFENKIGNDCLCLKPGEKCDVSNSAASKSKDEYFSPLFETPIKRRPVEFAG